MTHPDTARRSYQLVARTYDVLAHIYSFGRIRAVKASQVPELATGDRILYAGGAPVRTRSWRRNAGLPSPVSTWHPECSIAPAAVSGVPGWMPNS